MAIRIAARMYVQTLDELGNTVDGKFAEDVQLFAVYSADPEDPNHSYSKATPSGTLRMHISNPGAWGFFEKGAQYDVMITKRVD